MSILVDENIKVFTEGMTGNTGPLHTEQALVYGTQIVRSVTPALVLMHVPIAELC